MTGVEDSIDLGAVGHCEVKAILIMHIHAGVYNEIEPAPANVRAYNIWKETMKALLASPDNRLSIRKVTWTRSENKAAR